jgi:TetR/AcrR family transcriptional repressor of nem operon
MISRRSRRPFGCAGLALHEAFAYCDRAAKDQILAVIRSGLYHCRKIEIAINRTRAPVGKRSVKVSGRKVAEHRAALIATARRLLQEQGFEGAGVAEISRAAGLTQGALYAQFGSKHALAREAACKAFAEGLARWRELRKATDDPLSAYLEAYLAETHMEDAGSGCLMAACLSDMPRQHRSIGAALTKGFCDMIEVLEGVLPKGVSKEEAHRRALTLIPAMVGSVAMARAVEKTDPDLAREILAAARLELKRLAMRREEGPRAETTRVRSAG